jgi:tetratricopeptide (TPR) repeat protein
MSSGKSILIKFFVFLLTAAVLSGCEGGRLGSGGITPLGSAAEYIATGWEKFDKSQYTSAISDFNMALEREPNDTERAESNMGLGWSYARRDGIQSGQRYFEDSEKYFKDAKMGLAGAYFSNANREDYYRALDLLERIGLSSTDFNYTPLHNIGVTNAEAHALIGILYYFTGNEGAAQSHLETAKIHDNRISTSVDEIYSQLGEIL